MAQFFPVPYDAFRLAGAEDGCRLLVVWLFRSAHENRWRPIAFSERVAAKEFRVTRRTVARVVAELAEAGFIERNVKKIGGWTDGSTITVFDPQLRTTAGATAGATRCTTSGLVEPPESGAPVPRAVPRQEPRQEPRSTDLTPTPTPTPNPPSEERGLEEDHAPAVPSPKPHHHANVTGAGEATTDELALARLYRIELDANPDTMPNERRTIPILRRAMLDGWTEEQLTDWFAECRQGRVEVLKWLFILGANDWIRAKREAWQEEADRPPAMDKDAYWASVGSPQTVEEWRQQRAAAKAAELRKAAK